MLLGFWPFFWCVWSIFHILGFLPVPGRGLHSMLQYILFGGSRQLLSRHLLWHFPEFPRVDSSVFGYVFCYFLYSLFMVRFGVNSGVGVGVGFNSNSNSNSGVGVGIGVETSGVGVGVDIQETCRSWSWSWNLRSWSWSWSWYSRDLPELELELKLLELELELELKFCQVFLYIYSSIIWLKHITLKLCPSYYAY